jgi:hypothetical protein
MGIYYKCLRGDSEHLALMEPEAVAIRDSQGRNWICYPISDEEAENLPMAAHVSEVFQSDARARRHGLAEHGTEVRIYYGEDENDLTEKLMADTI